MASVTNTDGVFKGTYPGFFQSHNVDRILIFSGYFKVRESLHSRVLSWVNMSVPNHFDTKKIKT